VIPPSPPGTAPAIDVERRLVLQQRYAPMEIATGIEQPNQYDLFTETGVLVGRAVEISDGASGFLSIRPSTSSQPTPLTWLSPAEVWSGRRRS